MTCGTLCQYVVGSGMLSHAVIQVKQQNVTYAREKAELLDEMSQRKSKADANRERAERELNDEVEALRADKKRLKQVQRWERS